MKRFLILIILTAFLLSACGKKEAEKSEAKVSEDGSQPEESSEETKEISEESSEASSEEEPQSSEETAESSTEQETAKKKKKSKLRFTGTVIRYEGNGSLSFFLDEGRQEDEDGITEIPIGEEESELDLMFVFCQEGVEVLDAKGEPKSLDDLHVGQWVEVYSPSGSIDESMPPQIHKVDKIIIMGERSQVEQGTVRILEGEVIKVSSKNKRIFKVQGQTAEGETFVCRVDASMSAVLKKDDHNSPNWKDIKKGDTVSVYYAQTPEESGTDHPEEVKALRILDGYPLQQTDEGQEQIPGWANKYTMMEGTLLSIGEEEQELRYPIKIGSDEGEKELSCDIFDTILIGPKGSQLEAYSLQKYINCRISIVYKPPGPSDPEVALLRIFC